MMPDMFTTLARLADEARADLAAARLRSETAEIALADARDEIERLRALHPTPSIVGSFAADAATGEVTVVVLDPAPTVDVRLPSCEHMHTSALATVQCQLPPVHRGQCYAKHDLGAVAWWGRNPQP